MRIFFSCLLVFMVELTNAQTSIFPGFICNHEPSPQTNTLSSGSLSSNGDAITPKGELHVLVLFISFDDNTNTIFDYRSPNNPNAQLYWAPNDLPNWAKGESNDLFDKTTATIGQKKNLSNWFSIMSKGTFNVTGEVFPEMIILPASARTGNSQQLALNQIINNPAYANYPWSNFDRRSRKGGSWGEDNSSSPPDGWLDYVFVVYREQGVTTGFAGVSFNASVNPKVALGATATSFNLNDPLDNMRGYFLHELAHHTHMTAHYNGANDVRSDGTFFTNSHGWGFMGSYLPQFETANAWERWWLGWHNPIEVTGDVTLWLRDYMLQGDAVRIPLPGSPDDELWLEYHSRVLRTSANHPSDFDQKPVFGNPPGTQPGPGLYGYVTKGKNNKSIPVNNDQTNFIRHLHKEGNKDFKYVRDASLPSYAPSRYAYWVENDNPMSGYSKYQGILYDYDEDGLIQKSFSDGNASVSQSSEQFLVINSNGQLINRHSSTQRSISSSSLANVEVLGALNTGKLLAFGSGTNNIPDMNGYLINERFVLLDKNNKDVAVTALPFQANDQVFLIKKWNNKYLVLFFRALDSKRLIKRFNSDWTEDLSFTEVQYTTSGVNDYSKQFFFEFDALGNIYIVSVLFLTVNGQSVKPVVKINSAGTVDYNYSSQQIYSVSSIASIRAVHLDNAGKLLLGGRSIRINGIAYHLIRLNQNGSIDATFAHLTLPENNAFIYGITQLPGSGNYLVTGNYSAITPSTTKGLSILDNSGSVLSGWSGAGFTVDSKTIVKVHLLNQSELLFSGQFTSFNGIDYSKTRLFKTNLNGVVNTSFNFNLPDIFGNETIFHEVIDQTELFVTAMNSGPANMEYNSIYYERSSPTATSDFTLAVTGKSTDGFTIGDELGLSGIAPILPHPRYNRTEVSIEPVVLNGISVKVLSEANGMMQLQIKMNDREVRENKRWCGYMTVPPTGAINGNTLVLKSGKSILFDLSGTPSRIFKNPDTEQFGLEFSHVNPTHFVLESGSRFLLEPNSSIEATRLSQIEVAAGGEMILDQNSMVLATTKAKIIVNGTLTLKQGAMLLIDESAELIIRNGAQLVLESNSALIEIRGKLVIEENATFSITGIPGGEIGYVKFYPNAIVLANPGSKMVLGEVGNLRKVMELAPNTNLVLPTNLASFEIRHGEVKLGVASRIVSPAKATLLNSRFDLEGSTGRHLGLLLSGNHLHDLRGNWFLNAVTGLEINLNGNLNQPNLISNRFNNNQTGLLVHSGGLLVTGCYFNTNNTALVLSAMSATTQVVGGNFNENGNGIRVSGANSSPIILSGNLIQRSTSSGIGIDVIQGNVTLRSNTINRSYIGVSANGMASRVRMACNQISNASFDAVSITDHAVVDMSNQARNKILTSDYAVDLSSGTVLLQNGYNDFSFGNNTVIEGILAPTCYTFTTIVGGFQEYSFFELPADNNAFESSFQYPSLQSGSSNLPISGNVMYVNDHTCVSVGNIWVDPLTYYPVFRKSNNPNITFVSCGQASPPWWNDVYNAINLESNPSTWFVSSSLFPGVELKQAIRSALNEISTTIDQPGNDSLALEMFKQILTANYTNMNDEGRGLLATANEAMNFALSNAYSLGILPVKYGTVPEPLNDKVLTMLQTLDDLINSSDEAHTKAKYALDKVLLYRLAGHYETAIYTLLNSEANQHSNYLYWECILNAEWAYFQGNLNVDQFAAETQGCMQFFQARRANRTRPENHQIVNDLKTIANTITLSPNPTNATSILTFSTGEWNTYILVSDINGKTVHTDVVEANQSQYTLNSTSLQQGVYFVEVRAEGGVPSRIKWIVNK